MELWLDSINTQAIQRSFQQGVLWGVTTNPSILAPADRPVEDVLHKLLHVQQGPVAVQVIAEDCEGIIEQAVQLHAFSKRIIVKVPVTEEGMQAIRVLKAQQIPTMATVVFHARQYLIAALAGASYVAPYVGAMQKEAGEEPFAVLESMVRIKRHYGFQTKILGASLPDTAHIMRCAELGLDAITCKERVFAELTGNAPATLVRIDRFREDWVRTAKGFLDAKCSSHLG